MKGSKGGKRDKIISFLFSKKNEEKKDTQIENAIPIDSHKEPVINSFQELYENDNKDVDIQNEEKNNNVETSESLPDNETYYESNLDITEEKAYTEKDTSFEKSQDQSREEYDYSLEDTSELIPINLGDKEKSEEINTLTSDETGEKINAHTYTPITSKPDVSDKVTRDNSDTSNTIEYSVPIPTEDDDLLKDQELIEKSVVEALERIIKEDIYELEQIEYELEVLSREEEDEVLTDEVEKLKQRLEELILKFEKIKSIYYKSIDEEDLTKIDDDELYKLVTEYKENYKDSNLMEVVEAELKVIESYVSLIEQITTVEKSKDEIDEKIDEKLDKFQIRDEEFEEMKKDYENVEEISDIVESFNKEQERIMKELEMKMRNSEEITSRVERTLEVVPHFNRLIQAAIMISMSKRVPPTPRGNLIKASLMISAINMAAHFITTEERQRQVTTIKYQDFASDLKAIGKDIDGIIYKIDNAFDDISLIRENFKKECEEYAGQIPEYDELMKNLDRVEKELKEKQDIAKKYSKDFGKMLDMNNERVKRLEKQDNTMLVA